jgi:hypothetical protein
MSKGENKKMKSGGLPEGYDPYDINNKKALHPQADEKNLVVMRGNRKALACGGKKSNGDPCRSYAGMGTDHVGYGRCKFCGGNSTGPKTPEGKAAASRNSRKHGFYSQVLNKAERDTYEELLEGKRIGLENEIYMMKAKILSYLKEKMLYKIGSGKDQEVYFKDGNETAVYRAGTIEDKPLQRALETLRRLVDSHAKLTQDDSSTLLDQINGELRAASQGAVSISWGGPTQSKEGGN